MKFCTNQRVRVSDKGKKLLLGTELGTNLVPQFGLAAQTRSSEKLLLDFGFLRVSLDQRQSRSSEPTSRSVLQKSATIGKNRIVAETHVNWQASLLHLSRTTVQGLSDSFPHSSLLKLRHSVSPHSVIRQTGARTFKFSVRLFATS